MKDGRLFFFDYKDNESHILVDRVQMEQVSSVSAKNITILGYGKEHLLRRQGSD